VVAPRRPPGRRAEIELPDHFDMVTSDDEPLVVQTTPYGGSPGLKIVEDPDGQGGYEFAYTVKGTREGYADKQVVRAGSLRQPRRPAKSSRTRTRTHRRRTPGCTASVPGSAGAGG